MSYKVNKLKENEWGDCHCSKTIFIKHIVEKESGLSSLLKAISCSSHCEFALTRLTVCWCWGGYICPVFQIMQSQPVCIGIMFFFFYFFLCCVTPPFRGLATENFWKTSHMESNFVYEMLWLGWLKYFDIFLCLPLGLVSVSGESVILGKSVEESSITQPQHSLNYTTSVLNTVSHTVNIKWLLPYSCAPVTQARHVFHGEIRQFSIAPSCSLDKLRWPRTITDTDSCLFMSVTQIKKKKKSRRS